MKGSHLILAVAAALIILLAGCTGSQPNNPQAPAAPPVAQPTQPANPQPAEPTTGCTSPYDGTWKGVMADSGDLFVERHDSSERAFSTYNPYTASYDFEMAIKCDSVMTDPNAGTGHWFNITHVKASHPLFECAEGCTPATDSGMFIGNDGSGYFALRYPNGAYIWLATHGNANLQISQDGKTMEIFIDGFSGGWTGASIGVSAKLEDIQDNLYTVETYNCQQYGGEGSCGINSILKNTITLTKVS